jgi:hypothetical protein
VQRIIRSGFSRYRVPQLDGKNSGKCLTGVDSRSKGSSKFVSIDEESNHEIVHVLRLGEANCVAYETLNPGPEIDVFAHNRGSVVVW